METEMEPRAAQQISKFKKNTTNSTNILFEAGAAYESHQSQKNDATYEYGD
jgi:hypothetical protein